MKLYMNLVAMNLKSQMQYRVSFLLTTLGQFITAFTSFFGLYFIFSRVNAIDDFNYNQVFLCFAVVMMAFAIGEMFGGGLAVFPRIMGNGEFDRALVRPRNIILQILVPNMDFTRLGLLIDVYKRQHYDASVRHGAHGLPSKQQVLQNDYYRFGCMEGDGL